MDKNAFTIERACELLGVRVLCTALQWGLRLSYGIRLMSMASKLRQIISQLA